MRSAGVARLAALAAIWGSNFLWIKVALDSFSPVQVTLLRLVLGAVTLAVFVRAQGLRLPRSRATWGHSFVASLVANALPYWLFAYGEQHVPSSVAGALNATTPLWTVVVALLLGAEARPSALRVTGLLVGFLGSVVLLAPWASSNECGGITCDASLCITGAVACLDRFSELRHRLRLHWPGTSALGTTRRWC